MGKRKYGNEDDTLNKKSKHHHNGNDDSRNVTIGDHPPTQQETSITNEPPKHSGFSFDIKQFRKELASKQGQTTVLTQFLQVCLNPDSNVDYILEYLKSGGNAHEILRQVSSENKKNLTLATPAFHLFHLLIFKVQSSLPHMIAITEEACRYFLNTFMSTVEIMISENSGARHRITILKLLTSMVTLNPDLGIEVLNQAPLTPKHLQYIEKSNDKERDNVRRAFVHFMTSFFVEGHLTLVKALLEKQGLLALAIPGLVYDDVETVIMFMTILKKNVIENSFISKSLKLKTFSHQVLHNLFKLYAWKGPQELSNEVRNESRNEITELLSNIILTLFTSSKLGLYFIDNSLGMGDLNKNQNLFKALLTLKRPWENEHQGNVLLQIVYKCPDLHRAIITIVEHSFEPQHSPIWEKTTEFVMKLFNILKPEEMVLRMKNLNSIQAANFVRFVTLPVPLVKFIQTNLGKDLTISLYCIRILVKMLESLKKHIQILEMEESQIEVADLKNKLDYFFPKYMSTPSTIVSLINKLMDDKAKDISEKSQDYTLPQLNTANSLISLIDLLLLYNDIYPTFFETLEGNLDMKNILNYSANLTTDTSLLKFKVVSLWLTLDDSAISLKNPIFKDLFIIMLEVYTNHEDNTWIEAKETLHRFFKNTAIFESDEDEIHIMLYTLRNCQVNPTSLVDVVEYILSNKNELTEYIRNQIVHFETLNENNQAALDKLFEDLSTNKPTEGSVFLENKIPSSFIVGSIQYVQSNKNARKNLKHFLSSYIANLLHCNYSPELTEVLIGDTKLDVRSYVANWISQPVEITDEIAGKDHVLKNISKHIILGEDVNLEDVFLSLERATVEESDVTINEIGYKVAITENIDKSELLIWARYILYCAVRLTDMGQLEEKHQKIITDYFECIIAFGRKHHMIDVCRSIILAIFKNPHVLKIYSPLDLIKDQSRIIATKFLLHIIKKHSDITNYLNKNYNMLKPFQQKNCNEIVKALIKINKKKNLSSCHTVEVLNVIGLSNHDDLLVLKHIFSVEINSCINEDKEPTLVLHILSALIEKYSKTARIVLPHNILKKAFKLYTDLLTNKELSPNLSNFENALTVYFENKSNQVKHITQDNFKQFFVVNTTRKTTSQLASTLMKLNYKFCNVFKEEADRPEILTQREITLPLGDAILNHNQFLLDNKEFLSKIFSEYKTNIIKVLEKPHKAGQTYIHSWKFLRKIILECMELEDCKKLFSKNHKFDIAISSHTQLMQAVFLKICLLEHGDKREYFVNYYLNMLHILTVALKDNKQDDITTCIVSNIYSITKIWECVYAEQNKSEEDNRVFQKVTESSVWQNLYKAILKQSLKVRTMTNENSYGPQLLYLLSNLVKQFYSQDHEEIVTLFDVVTSHSEFLNVLLSHHSPEIKSRLIEFIFVLIVKNNSVMKTQQIPVYLSAYLATKSPCDRLLLSILNYYETHGQPLNEYNPYLWGDSAANYYAVRKNRTSSLWSHPTPNRILSLFEKEVVERTVKNFPVNQKLEYNYELPPNIHMTNDEIVFDDSTKTLIDKMTVDGLFKYGVFKDNETAVTGLVLKAKYGDVITKIRNRDMITVSHVNEDEGIYDPACLLPLLDHLLAPGSMASCFKMLRSGLLSVPVMALSSLCPMMRASAYHVLHRFWMLLETETRHKNDKLLLSEFMSTLRRSLTSAIDTTEHSDIVSNGLKNPRLPAIDSLYLAKALIAYTAPLDPLYKPVNNFLRAKLFVDLSVVPDFLGLFHDNDLESSERRLWILDVIAHGCKTMTDVNVIFKTMCLKMIMDFYCSVLSNSRTKEKILEVINALVAIPRALEIMIEGYGLLSWLHAVICDLKSNEEALIKSTFVVVKTMLQSMTINSFSRHLNAAKVESKQFKFSELKLNKEMLNEILTLLRLLPVKNHLSMFDNPALRDIVKATNFK